MLSIANVDGQRSCAEAVPKLFGNIPRLLVALVRDLEHVNIACADTLADIDRYVGCNIFLILVIQTFPIRSNGDIPTGRVSTSPVIFVTEALCVGLERGGAEEKYMIMTAERTS